MPDNQKSVFESFANELGKELGEGLRDLHKDFTEAVDALDKAAGKAALGAEKLYNDYKVGDRAAGATAGVKAGVVVGAAAALVGLKVLAVPVVIAGGAIGIVKGPSIVRRGSAWLDRHRAANDEGPKPPSD